MVHVEQLYTGCLAHAAYFVESNGEAVVIDPLRDPRPYLELAKKYNATIKYILETHFHADFVSGHVDIEKATGATIVYGPTAVPGFNAHVAADQEEIKVGNVTFVVLHTPGHTLESSTFLMRDEDGKDKCIFSGDTLFLGDVGRPDLAQKAANMTQSQLATLLYNSLRTKIMPLADDVIVYPGHGAGSACGKNLSKETIDTLGNQKIKNYALRADMSVDEFVVELTEGLHAPPEYFPHNVAMNKNPNKPFTQILADGHRALSLEEFEAAMNSEPKPLVLDTRNAIEFTAGFMPGSIFLGIDGGFAPYMGTVFPELNRPILFIAKDDSRLDEMITRATRIGHDNILGHLKGGFATYAEAGRPLLTIENITPEQLAAIIEAKEDVNIVDVRRPPEVARAGIKPCTAKNIPMMAKTMAEYPLDKPVVAFCASGYRSVLVLSTLMSQYGLKRAINVVNGMAGIELCESMQPFLRTAACPKASKKQ